MGIKGAFGGSRLVRPFFQRNRRDLLLTKLGEGVILVDASGIIHAGLANHAHNVVSGQWGAFDQEMASRLNLWKHGLPAGMRVIFVFDGFRCSAKKVNEDRAQERSDALLSVEQLSGLIEDARLEAEQMRVILSGSAATNTGEVAASFQAAREERIRALRKHKSDLSKAEGTAASGRAQEAAYRVIRLCKDRSLQFVVSAGEAEHSMAAMCALNPDIKAVCGYDSDFFVLACPAVLYGQGLQGVMNLLSWEAVDDSVQRIKHIEFDKHLQPNSTARMSEAQQEQLATAMHAYGAQLVVQLTALLSNNDYTRYEQVGMIKYVAAWATMCAKKLPPTLVNYATCVAEAMPAGKQPLEKRLVDYIHRAERAAFMYFGQPVIVAKTLYLPQLPPFVSGCTATLFKEAPPHGVYAVGTTLPYLLQDDTDHDVLQLFSFFAEVSPDDRSRWAEGGVDISSSNPFHLIDAPELELSSGYSLKSKRPQDVVNALSFNKLKLMAKRFAVPFSGVNEADLRKMVKANVQLHFRVMAGNTMDERTYSQGDAYTKTVNKAKNSVSKELRDEVARATCVDLTSASAMKDYFLCPLQVLNTWELLLDDMPCVVNSRRVSEARTRTVRIEKFAVQTANPNRGYVVMRVKKSLGAWHDVILDVVLESAPADPAGERNVCEKRAIKSIERAVCLLPDGAVGADGAVRRGASGNIAASVKKTRFCYGGEFCVHAAAATRHLHVATAKSTTDEAAWWMKRQTSLVQDDSAATDAPFATVLHGVTGEAVEGGTPMSLRSFNPVPEKDRAAINKGIGPDHGDSLYHLLYLEYRRCVLFASGKHALKTDILTHVDEIEALTEHPPARVIGSKGVPPDEPTVAYDNAAGTASASDVTSSHGSDVVVITAAQMAARTGPAVVPMMVEEDDVGAAAAPTDDEAEHDDEGGTDVGVVADQLGGPPGAKREKLGEGVTTRTQTAEAAKIAAKQAKKSKRHCFCPLGKACDVNSPNERDPLLPRFKSFTLKGKGEEHVAHVRAILKKLGVEGDALEAMLTSTQVDINPGHFVEEAFWQSGRGWETADSAGEISQMRVVAVQLDKEKLRDSHEVFMGYRDNCICGDKTCDRELDKTNSVALVRDRRGVDMKELKRLRVSQDILDMHRIKAYASRDRVRIDNRHFTPGDTTVTVTQDATTPTLRRRKSRVASTMKVERPATRTSPEDRATTSLGRRQASQAGIDMAALGDEAAANLGRSIQQLQEQLENAYAENIGVQEQADVSALGVKRREELVELLETKDDKCKKYTGELNFACLKAKFNYLNARGVLDRLVYWHNGGTRHASDDVRGRKRLLTPFECYMLYKIRLRLGSAAVSGTIFFCFQVSPPTVHRVFATYLRAVVYIMSNHQTWPTEQAMRANTDAATHDAFGLQDQTIVIYGDATERECLKPARSYGVVYSDYKGRTTLKYNLMCVDGGYATEISLGYAGKTSDNQLHRIDEIPKRIALACGKTPAILVYDKGLNSISEFADNVVLLLRPYAKDVGQVATSAEDAHLNRRIASRRVIVENIFAEARTYKAFGDHFSICNVVQADLVANAVRCEINTRPTRGRHAP